MKSTASISAVADRRALADGHSEDVLGNAALEHALTEQQRGHRRQRRRLEDDRVTGGERRDAVAEAVRQRVVPGTDHADDADRRIADDELAAEHEGRGGADLLVGEVLGRVLRPEAEGGSGVGDLGELRVLVGLAVLLDDRVDDPLGVVEHPLLHAPQDPGATVEAERLPGRLRRAGLDRPSRRRPRGCKRQRCRSAPRSRGCVPRRSCRRACRSSRRSSRLRWWAPRCLLLIPLRKRRGYRGLGSHSRSAPTSKVSSSRRGISTGLGR